MALAIANDSDQTRAYAITAYDANSTQIASVTRQIGARTSIAAFLSDLLPALPRDYYGQVIVSSTTGTASIIGLRFTGTTFTTIPETAVTPPPSSPPTLTSISPASGTAGMTLTATLTGTNFVNGGTTVQVSGSGITLGSPQVSGSTSLAVAFTISASASPGNRTVTVATNGGTSNGVNFSVLAPAVPPTLASISPTSGTAGITVTATLTGTNFVAGGTIVQITGSGITVDSPQVAGSTSLTVAFTISASASPGNRTVTVATNGGTSNGINFSVSAPSKSFNQTQTERLFGTWVFSYTIITAFTDTYRLNDVEASTVTPGEWLVFGTNQFGGRVLAQYAPTLNQFVLYDPGTIIDKFYAFVFTGTNSVSGCYYLIQPPGSTNLSKCYPMTGIHTSNSAITSNTTASDVAAAKAEKIRKAEISQDSYYGESDQNLILTLEALQKGRRTK